MIYTRRWYRGRTMLAPAILLALLLVALWPYIYTDVLTAQRGYSTAAVAGVAAIPVAWVVWGILMGLWEMLVHLSLSPRQRNTHHNMRQVSYDEALYAKNEASDLAKQMAPVALLGGIFAAAEGDRHLLELDALATYTYLIQPLQYWSNAEATIRNGGEVWLDVPPVNRREMAKVMKLYVLAWLGLVFIGLQHDPHVTQVAWEWIYGVMAFIVVVWNHRKIARAFERSAIRRDHG